MCKAFKQVKKACPKKDRKIIQIELVHIHDPLRKSYKNIN